jgi:hypothetical protein
LRQRRRALAEPHAVTRLARCDPLKVRRLFCGNPDPARMLTGIALALAGRIGERLAALLDLMAGRSSLLRLVMALPDPESSTMTALGVDDFAFRRGRDYVTVSPLVLLGARMIKASKICWRAQPAGK